MPRTPVQKQNKPLDFCILGAPKCGTTALYTYLRAHPRVFMPQIKEPNFYADDIPDGHPRLNNRQAYFELFANATDGQILGEASALYLLSERAVPNILRDSPDARFIVMLRNPVDMAQSLHSQLVVNFYEDERSFQKAWELQEVRAAGQRISPWCAAPNHLIYRKVCSFAWQLERLFQRVSRERVLVLVYEEFFANPKASHESTLAFLGLPPDNRTDFQRINENWMPRSWLLHKVGHRLTYYKPFVPNPLYGPLKRTANAFGLRPGATFLRWNARTKMRAPLDKSFRRQLEAAFQPDIARLERILGRDFDVWRSNK